MSPRNIVILFNESLTQEFIDLGEKIDKKVPSKIVLNRFDMIPHMSLYTTNYPEENLGKIPGKLSLIARNTKPFSVGFNKKSIMLGTIFLDAATTSALQTLHEIIVDSCNTLREGLFDEKERELPGFSEENELSLTKYGMWAAKELYMPHVSLARPIDPTHCEEALQIVPENVFLEFVVNEIALVEGGPHGTCKRVIEKFPLVG